MTPTQEQTKAAILALLEAGDLEEAGTRLLAYQDAHPEDPEAWTYAATLFMMEGRGEPAEQALRVAADADPERYDVWFMLGDLYEKMEAPSAAHGAYEVARRLAPDELRGEVERAMARVQPAVPSPAAPPRPRLAVICGPDDGFVLDLERRWAETFEVRPFHFTGQVDLKDIQAALDWADVAWFEWCDMLLVHASQRLRKTCKVVCRVHSYETFTAMPSQVTWGFVDHLVFVAPHIRDLFFERHAVDVPSTVIPNGVDLEALAFTERRAASADGTRRIAYVGYLNFKKNPELILQVMAHLVKRDPRCEIHIAGAFQEPRYEYYFRKMIPALGLGDHVHLHGWVGDIDAWLEDKSYVLSTSVLEGCPVNIIEAMAKGIKPIVHNWVGAESLYPPEFLFNTVEEAADRILAEDYDPRRYRAFVEERHSLAVQVQRSSEVLHAALARAPEPDAPSLDEAIERLAAMAV